MKKTLLIFLICFLGHLPLFADYINMQRVTTSLYDTQSGLSSTKITCALQDNRAFLWIGTKDGLNKFNGYDFTIYRKVAGDSLSIKSNHTTVLFQDSKGTIWVGTNEGVEYYDLSLDGFLSVSLQSPGDVLETNPCTAITEDKKGNLWFAISGHGVLSYSKESGACRLLAASGDTASIGSNNVCSIIEDTKGNMWFASEDNGISVFNPATGAITNYRAATGHLPGDAISHLCLMKNGNILISTLRNGLIVYEVQQERFVSYPDIFNNSAMRSVLCSVEDELGNILIGTESSGVMIFDPEKKTVRQHPMFRENDETIGRARVNFFYKGNFNYMWMGLNHIGLFVTGHEDNGFYTIRRRNYETNTLNDRSVTAITTDREKNIWIATEGGGLCRYDETTGTYTNYSFDLHRENSLSDNDVASLLCDSKNRIWASTYTGGLCLLDRGTGTFTRFMQEENQPDGLQSNYISSIREDRKGNLWLGTNGGGLTCFDPQKRTFRTYRSAANQGLVNDYINILFIDSKDRIWIGTYFGLSCMDPAAGTFADRSRGLSNQSVYAISEDGNGTIWAGTADGLNKYDAETDSFIFIVPRTLAYHSSVVNGILPYGEYLWLSTNRGLIRFRYDGANSGETRRFFENSGLQGNEFIHGAYHKDAGGRMFFGGTNGLNFFHPDHIIDYDLIPKVYITALKVSNEPVPINGKVNGRVILTQNIETSKKIRLRQSDRSFSLEFVGMEAKDPPTLLYACKLEGFDKEWLVNDYTHRSVAYTNLNPGTYTFRIKASNNPEKWGEGETTLTIEIAPYPWNTWYARTGYGIIILLILYLILHTILTRIRDKNALQIERLKVKQQEELNTVRNNFFTNISHEFRTPLTLIVGPLKRMAVEEKEAGKKETLSLMLRNAKRLQHLINQVLDLNKMKESKVKLHVHKIELAPFVGAIVKSFGELKKEKRITLEYTCTPREITAWYDPEMLEKCLYNIIYNAFKFTNKGGHISVQLEGSADDILITVSDNGIGMDEETSRHIFERFYQGKNKFNTKGSGIGLNLVKTTAELHQGSVSVTSQKGEGSAFYFHIRPGNAHFNPDDLVIPRQDEGTPPEGEDLPDANRPTLLIVEDDSDMRYYIKQELKDQYAILEAANGKTGLAKAQKHMPDLIIADLMMPEMNGIELTRILKTNTETSHIPIIILTAQSDMEYRLKGLETGADSYIQKPFDSTYLKIRIEKLIELRRMMKERFSKSISMEAKEMILTSTDEKLLQNAIDYVRNNMESIDLSVESMSKELGLSRTHLHRKLKALTGQSPVEFIKMIRMKQAAYLLATGKLSIAEVGYKVGYNTPSYFSSSFSTFFGLTPTAYMENPEQLLHHIKKEDK